MSGERLFSVIIPYFQKTKGILERTLKSVQEQNVPEGWRIEIIVVDDGSPYPPDLEVGNIIFPQNIEIKVLAQPNCGVASARNHGLDSIDSRSEVIAFLDSDDIWPKDHAYQAIEALNLGYDFVFSDNMRLPNHVSYLLSCAPLTHSTLNRQKTGDGLYEVPRDEMLFLLLKEFPCHISSIAFKRSISSDIRFDTNLNVCGEDIVYLSMILMHAKKICFNARSSIICGEGVNIYFSHFNWDDPKLISIKRSQITCYQEVQKIKALPKKAKAYVQERIRHAWYDFSFHSLRLTLKHRRLPYETIQSLKEDRGFCIWFPIGLLYTTIGKIFGLYNS